MTECFSSARWRLNSSPDRLHIYSPKPTSTESLPRRFIFRLLTGTLLSAWVGSRCEARIPTEDLSTLNRVRQMPTPEELIGARKPSSRVSPELDIKAAVVQIMQWMHEAELKFSQGDYRGALGLYDLIVESYPDLAITEYARLHRAFCLYELNEIRRCLVDLNDLEVSLRGFPEVHALLAVVLYNERPLQRSRSEEQWDLALEFDGRFSDPLWVQENKKWSPKMMRALNQFLTLS